MPRITKAELTAELNNWRDLYYRAIAAAQRYHGALVGELSKERVCLNCSAGSEQIAYIIEPPREQLPAQGGYIAPAVVLAAVRVAELESVPDATGYSE